MSIDVRALRRHYRTHGFVTGVPVLSSEEAGRVLARIRAVEAAEEARGGGTWGERDLSPQSMPPHPIEDVLGPLVRDPRVLEPVRALLGETVLLRNCDVFIKTGATDIRISWHTDTGRIGRSTDGMLSLWLALTPATAENGALEFVSGSHRYDEPPPVRDKRALTLPPDQAEAIDPDRVVRSVLEPGMASMHHFGLVHRSDSNRSGVPRVAVVMRFMAPWVSHWAAESGSATLVCGVDRHGKFGLQERFPVSWTIR